MQISPLFYFLPFSDFNLLIFKSPDTPKDYQKAEGPSSILLRGVAIQAWSVFTKIIQVVFSALVLDA